MYIYTYEFGIYIYIYEVENKTGKAAVDRYCIKKKVWQSCDRSAAEMATESRA